MDYRCKDNSGLAIRSLTLGGVYKSTEQMAGFLFIENRWWGGFRFEYVDTLYDDLVKVKEIVDNSNMRKKRSRRRRRCRGAV